MSDAPTVRESYHHGDLRQAIIEAACSHLRHDNAESLSLRALARDIGVSQTAPYRHFDSKNALFAAIATWGFQLMEKEMLAPDASLESNSKDAMIGMGLAYLNFSQEHYEKYQLFFDSSMVEFDEYPDLVAASQACFAILLERIRAGQAAGWLRAGSSEALAGTIWAGLHGVASLLQINRRRAGFTESEVGKAVSYLADNSEDLLNNLLKSIEA